MKNNSSNVHALVGNLASRVISGRIMALSSLLISLAVVSAGALALDASRQMMERHSSQLSQLAA